MAVSKTGFFYPRMADYENDGDISWCKFVIGFPNPKTGSPEYYTFQKAMKRKMEQERIPGFVRSTADQWAAIQPHALTLPHVPHGAPLWQTHTRRGQRFTECFDYLLRDIAKKHQNNLVNLLRVPLAGPASSAGPAGPAGPGAPVAVVNNRKLSQNICTELRQNMLIWRLQLWPVRATSASG